MAFQNTVRNFSWIALTAAFVSVAATADRGTASETARKPASDDWSELIQPPTSTADQQQRDNFAAFTSSLANESFAEAEMVAKQMVEDVDRDAVDASLVRARALHNLAVAQQFRGSHESAIQNYSAALDFIVGDENHLSPALILTLRGLAIAYLDAGREDAALAAFERALHVSSVNYGPHSFKQLPIVNSKMQVYLEQDDPSSALEMLDRIVMIYSRKYSQSSEGLLPAVYQQAELYRQLDMLYEERAAWRHILAIKQEHHAENDLTLIEPNIRIAENFIRELRKVVYRSGTTPTAEKHLKKALWIAENSPQGDWKIRKDCLLAIADYYTLVNVGSRANRYYAAAWDLMSSDEAYLVARAENLEMPVPLARPRPDPYANFKYNSEREKINQDDYLDGEIVMRFTVNVRGRTQDVRLVESDPPNFSHMERRVRNSVKEFVYRPRYVDGMAAATSDQQYRVRYFYLPSEYRASAEKSQKRVRP